MRLLVFLVSIETGTRQTIKDVTDIMFGEWHVYLGKQDKIQVIESEVWL